MQGFTKVFFFFFFFTLSKCNHSLVRASERRLHYLETHVAFLVSSVLCTGLQSEGVHTFFRSTNESQSESEGENTSARLKCYVLWCATLAPPKKKGPCSVKLNYHYYGIYLQLAKACICTSPWWSTHALLLKALGNNRECCQMTWLPNFCFKPWY